MVPRPDGPRPGPVAPGTARGRRRTPVEHVEVQPGEHALAGPSCRERAAAAHHHVQHGEGDEVSLLRGREGRLGKGHGLGRTRTRAQGDLPGRSSSPAQS